jgi:hypothetical protein
MLWMNCPGVVGTPKWGDQTWASGYPEEGWGHMSAEVPELFNNSTTFNPSFSSRTFRSDHSGGVFFVFLDGSVRFLSETSDPLVRVALVTREGEESVNDF